MDKDNLIVTQLFKTLTQEGLELTSKEAQDQALSATLLMLLGLILTVAGFITILLKLKCLASCSFLIMLQRIDTGWLQKYRHQPRIKNS